VTVTQKSHESIAAATGVGAVHLSVTDGERATRFYRDTVGLVRLPSDGGIIRMGAAGKELVVLHPGAAGPVQPHTTGLYHLAIVVPNRKELARVIARLFQQHYPNSPTDHTMTKSDYLWDPDGNGIEVYAESPEDGTFMFDGDTFAAIGSDGRMRSGRDPIDLDELFLELKPGDQLDAQLPAGTRMGHVHLHVSHLGDAVDFYHGLIGFDIMGMSERLGAAFISAGGYHHHLGLNTWAGVGAPSPSPTLAGLRHFTIELPDHRDLEKVLGRLQGGGIEPLRSDDAHEAIDPSQNRVRLAVRG
jgi:catechol 2,3-dioxygenase